MYFLTFNQSNIYYFQFTEQEKKLMEVRTEFQKTVRFTNSCDHSIFEQQHNQLNYAFLLRVIT